MSGLQAIVSPSLLAADFSKVGDEVKHMLDHGADWMHMDVMDGHFVPQITMGPPVLAAVHKKFPNLFMDCHMMVSDPAKWVKPVAEAGGRSFTFHLEALADPENAHELVAQIHAAGMRSAVGISPSTPSSAISDKLGSSVDMLLVMTVVPGAGGQAFMPECVPKVAELRKRFPGKDIEVDGGVGPGNVCQCANAGSNVVVAGTSLFKAEDPTAVMKVFRDSIEDARAAWGSQKVLDAAVKGKEEAEEAKEKKNA